MVGKRKPQMNLFDVGNVYALALKRGSFHAQLAEASPRLFDDSDFASIYAEHMGRPSVPPSLVALMVLLEAEAGVSDQEAIERSAFDLRWAAVLGKTAGEPLCAKSTLQLFRTHLILHDEVRTLFQTSIQEARKAGLLKGNALRVAIDTKPITGRGAVLDTFNLLAAGIRQLAAALARNVRQKPEDWLQAHNMGRYTEVSLKGATELDWSDDEQRSRFLNEVVADARRLVELAAGSDSNVRKSAELLQSVLMQDIEPAPTQGVSSQGVSSVSPNVSPRARIKQGTAKARIPSASDPELRHGRKSKSKTFTGHKASVVADTDSQIILAADVLAGDAGDATDALKLVQEAEENAQIPVGETLGDCAYGGSETRQEFNNAGRTLHAKVPHEAQRNLFPKSAFNLKFLNAAQGQVSEVTCPAGQTTQHYATDSTGRHTFAFGSLCNGCPLREHCTTSAKGRTLSVHPLELQLQQARAYQQSVAGRQHMRERVVIEHRLARLGQLGIGQAIYRGRTKTRFQLLICATIANLRLTWNWQSDQGAKPADRSIPASVSSAICPLLSLKSALQRAFRFLVTVETKHNRISRIPTGILQQKTAFTMKLAFRPGF